MFTFIKKKKKITTLNTGLDYSVCIDIASLISDNDVTVVEEIRKCIKNPTMYFKENQQTYQERYIIDTQNIDAIIWLGMVDCLEKYKYLCERDHTDECKDFIYFLNTLKTTKDKNIVIKEEWCDGQTNKFIPEWCKEIDKRLSDQDLVVSCIDIDSDSYILFICKKETLSKLKVLAKSIHHKIDLACKS